MKTIAKSNHAPVTDEYLDLIRAFPLRELCSEAEHDEAVRVLGRILGRPSGRLSPGERDYANVLGCLIEDFGHKKHPFLLRKHSPLEILRFLLEQHSMNVTALGKILGNKTAASLVLSGRRELSKLHIRRLADHFSVDPGLFI